jgi:crotonobetainyl-CoA:carnitine CoA-transferase CaiB-like acyl-CoA transferase
MTPAGPGKPPADVRILDISKFHAAPLCSMFLADFGADVIKVERPGRGDGVRYCDKDGVGLYSKVITQNVVGKLSRTSGGIEAAGPGLGADNREILVDPLGYSGADLAAAGIDVAPAIPTASEKRAGGRP